MIGNTLLPRMMKAGYDKKISMGPIMAVGGIDMLIPPSALAVLLASLAEQISRRAADRRHRARSCDGGDVHRLCGDALPLQSRLWRRRAMPTQRERRSGCRCSSTWCRCSPSLSSSWRACSGASHRPQKQPRSAASRQRSSVRCYRALTLKNLITVGDRDGENLGDDPVHHRGIADVCAAAGDLRRHKRSSRAAQGASSCPISHWSWLWWGFCSRSAASWTRSA